ncbi:beta-lactamase family protein [Sphingobacterium sp. SGG-5]|uniref:serine hydrolase domain-containing protein n=1 Tax=Sphingobacterium sp. SGG-5 TaxID=2710881 RepID=UPI0013ED1D60|nr:serine hydrolase domain-containing protein [Sphingobacterium sp. SGG-5]NGM62501.1 beta-lactamase family protein [Sphingobacterium sp. SGG-5]
MRFTLFLFAPFLFFLFIACSNAQKKQQQIEKNQAELDSIALLYNPLEADEQIDAFMHNLHKRSGFNGNVLIAKKGKIIYQNTFGWADYLHKDSLKIDSRFELASVSKPMTALAVLQLVDQEKIRLDQEIEEFFPGFPYPGVTVEQLLTHRSGLPNYVYFAETVWPDRKKGMTNSDVVKLLIEHKPARYGKPDGRFLYNNSNYMLLAAVVEQVTGLSFADYMKLHVFRPAGMKNTAILSKAEYDQIPTDVIGHDRVWRRSVVQNYLDGPVGDKGVYSTVQDMYLLDIALKEGRLLKKELLDSAYIGRSDPKRGLFSYGYGWRTFSPPHAQIVYHTGWWHGFKNLYVRDLTDDITIVLLSNMVNGSLNHLDNLYKILEMPILRKNAYDSNGGFMDHE